MGRVPERRQHWRDIFPAAALAVLAVFCGCLCCAQGGRALAVIGLAAFAVPRSVRTGAETSTRLPSRLQGVSRSSSLRALPGSLEPEPALSIQTLGVAALTAALCGLGPRRLQRRRRLVLGSLGSRVSGPTGRTAKAKSDSEDEGSRYKDTILLPQTEFAQRANAKKREPELQEWWRTEGIYEQLLQRADKGTFSLHDGPPYANGSLHMGHALNKILKDFINKFKASQGYRVRYIPGWDCHGLPIELKVLQSLKSKARRELTPLKLRKVAAQFARETVAEQRKSFERYGVWGEFENPYLTLLPKYEAAQLEVFEKMLEGGHIYRGRKPVYWSPSSRTALAEAELEYPEGHVSPSIYVAFACDGVPDSLKEVLNGMELEVAVWTTTPWTIPANRAVAVNPDLRYAVVKAEWEDGRNRRLVVASGLVESLEATLGASLQVEVELDGGDLEGLQYKHPLTGKVAPVVMGGDYITTESGTGLVHTAPGHGADDYIVGQKYGLEVAAPVDNAGSFTEEVGVEELVGANVLKDANERVINLLSESGSLLVSVPYEHKYPYDWRSKKPVIMRATPQWFASIEGLRQDVVGAMEAVNFIPESYANRMRPMLVGRSDWCISRQRAWGVPIPAFYKKDSGESLLTPAVVKHVRKIVAEKGSDAWWELSVEDLLPEELKADADLYEKGTDTMDVWFDSGSSWAAVQEDIGHPVDLYLEGQDQHRGWFQSSLITSVAVNGGAPYKSVMTHGFCVDENGRKMSKSIGNVIDPSLIIEGGPNQKQEPPYGADVLRLWAASVDFTVDVAMSKSIMATTFESLRKVRNRFRFMLGNISDFDAAEEGVAYEELPLLDRHVIHRAEETFDQMAEFFESYSFSRASKALMDFLNEISSFYLDASKDRLYIDARRSYRRRSCQTVLRWLLESVSRAMSPMLSHLAEDVWQALPGQKPATSVFLAGWPEPFPRPEAASPPSPALVSFRELLTLKDPANLALEKARRAGKIGPALQARVHVYVDPTSKLKGALESLDSLAHPDVDGLRFILGASAAGVSFNTTEIPEDEMAMESEALGVTVTVSPAAGRKCARCWVVSETVGDSEAHPHICERCVSVVEAYEEENAEEKEKIAA